MARLSANLGFLWPDRPLLDRIAAARAAGFGAVELHWPYEVDPAAVAAACFDAKVTLVSLNTPTGREGEFGLAALPGREADFRASFTQALDYAVASGTGAIHVLAGLVEDRAQSTATFVSNLRRAADDAAQVGKSLLIEPMNGIDRPGYYLDSVECAADIVATAGAPNLRIMFDVYHIERGQGGALERLEECLPLVGHVQIASVPDRHEPDEGVFDCRALFELLERKAYAGRVGCEYRPRSDTDEGLVWIERCGLECMPVA